MKSFDSIVRLFKLPTKFVDVYFPYIFHVAVSSLLFMFLINVFFSSLIMSTTLLSINPAFISSLENSSNINEVSNVLNYLISSILPSVAMVLILYVFMLLLMYSLIDAMYVYFVKGIYSGKKSSIEDSVKKALTVVPTVFFTNLVIAGLILLATLLLICVFFAPIFLNPIGFFESIINPVNAILLTVSIIAFVIVLVLGLFFMSPFFMLIVPVIVFEKKGVLDSIKSSFVHGKKNYLSLLAFNVLFMLTIMLVGIIMSILYNVMFIPIMGPILLACLMLVFEAYLFAVAGSMSTVLYLDYVKNSKSPI